MGFSIYSMVVDDVHFLCFFLFSSWFAFTFVIVWFDDIEWVRMNGSCLLKNENENEWNLVWEWTNKLNFNFLLLSARERNVVFSSFSSISTFFEWHFQEQKHLKRENGNEMEKYLLLANRQWIKMNAIRSECCFQWDLECLIKLNQIKSNQIILSNITYPIRMWIQRWYPDCILVSEGRSKQSSKHNSHFISFQFAYFSWLMCCHNYYDHW